MLTFSKLTYSFPRKKCSLNDALLLTHAVVLYTCATTVTHVYNTSIQVGPLGKRGDFWEWRTKLILAFAAVGLITARMDYLVICASVPSWVWSSLEKREILRMKKLNIALALECSDASVVNMTCLARCVPDQVGFEAIPVEMSVSGDRRDVCQNFPKKLSVHLYQWFTFFDI